MLFWPVMVIIGLLIVFFMADIPLDVATMDEAQKMRMIYLVLLCAVLALLLFGRLLVRSGKQSITNTLLSLGVVGGLVTAWFVRDDARVIVDEIRGTLAPSVAMSRTEGEAVLWRNIDGQFHADAEVNGIPLRMMVDTGATMVTIPYEEAARLGIDVENLKYTIPVVTASGRTEVARVHLYSIRIGSVWVFDVEGSVTRPGELRTALLGMTYLGRLSEATFRGKQLILRN